LYEADIAAAQFPFRDDARIWSVLNIIAYELMVNQKLITVLFRFDCDLQLGGYPTVRHSHLDPILSYADNQSSVFSFVLTDGGTALLFWGFIAIGLGMMLVYASLAEMASMYVHESLLLT
jgi:hypothetical protein